MSITLDYTRDELFERLNALLPAAKKADEKALAAHAKAEQAYLKKFHAACRDALKWDYQTAKAHYFEPKIMNGRHNSYDAPTCPRSVEQRLTRTIAFLERTTQTRFHLSPRGKWSDIYELLTADVPREKGLC